MNTSIALDSSRHLSEDRGDIIYLPDGFCLAIADGAGGISGGAEAADLVLKTVSSVIPLRHHGARLRQHPDQPGQPHL